MAKCSDTLSLYFHLDPEVAHGRRTFHFHVLLTDRLREGARKQIRRRSLSGGYSPTLIWQIPPDGNPSQQVRQYDSETGTICAVGSAKVDGFDPGGVKAKIYDHDPGPSNPLPDDADDAQLVNMYGEDDFDCPDGIPQSCNFIFHPDYDNELGGALHSASGTQNYLVVWVDTGYGNWVQCDPHPFMGVSSDTAECGDAAAPAPVADASAEYKLSSTKGTFPPPGTEATLRRADEECSESEQVWKSSSKTNPDMQWKLWVTKRGGKPRAVLALQSIYGARLEAPIIWRAAKWSFDGPNRLALDSPSQFVEKVAAITIVPA